MRRVVAGLAITLDGVVEGPSQTGWLMFNDEMGELIAKGTAQSDAILIGRRTYLDFAQRWPNLGSEVPMADFMNNTTKYVVSKTLHKLEWANSVLLSGDLVEEVSKLKAEQGKDIQIPGSPKVVRSLLRAGLLDELSLMIHPLVLGSGFRLFDDFGDSSKFRLVESKALRTGVLSATYQPAET